ncbi:MAG TPA: GNAT family N-acetyltransferase [Saprospiraceae bacterium]|nr:GNAT family N-acetyltransferase [Saprospiraceae bacterium]
MKKNDNLIPEIDKDILRKELSPDRYIRKTNKLNNEVYIVNHHNAPHVMREIGRLRELSFREPGGGTGMALDIDEYDTSERCYQQMIIYNPEEMDIVGGYRFIKCQDAYNEEKQKYELSTLHYFNFSEEFVKDYLPRTIELGRSWIQPKYQAGGVGSARRGVFALDNLWDGLGAIIHENEDSIDYLFGKVTMYPDYNKEARDALLHFMHYYFPDKDGLVVPKEPLGFTYNWDHYRHLFEGKTYKEGHRALNKFVRERKENIPPLINSYMNLTSTMKTFGSALNDDFGEVEETGILVTIRDIHEKMRHRYIGKFE